MIRKTSLLLTTIVAALLVASTAHARSAAIDPLGAPKASFFEQVMALFLGAQVSSGSGPHERGSR